jgi:hypothetical protein
MPFEPTSLPGPLCVFCGKDLHKHTLDDLEECDYNENLRYKNETRRLKLIQKLKSWATN